MYKWPAHGQLMTFYFWRDVEGKKEHYFDSPLPSRHACTPEPSTALSPSKYFFQLNLLYNLDTKLLGGSGGVVNSLDFCLASLKSLAAFTSGAYFLPNGRRWR